MAKVRQVGILKLKKGMYVVDTTQDEALEPPLYSVEGYILHDDEGNKLAKRGFAFACVDEVLSAVLPEPDLEQDLAAATATKIPRFPSRVSMQKELVKAHDLHNQAVEAAKQMHATLDAGLSASCVRMIQDILRGSIESLERNENAMLSMARLKAADEYTFTHSVNVAMYAVVLGRRLHVKESFLPDLALAGFFHDIGKILVPQGILHSPRKLDPDSLRIMQGHASLGGEFLEHYSKVPPIVRVGATEHHERCGGKGYPLGKKEKDISLVGKILAVVDVYDALTSKRCYKNAFTPSKSLSIMYKNKDNDFAPGFMEAFIDALGVYPVGSIVKLSNNYIAVVTEHNPDLPLQPKVVTLIDAFGDKVDYPKVLNLEIHSSISIVEPMIALPRRLDLHETILNARS